MKKQGAKLNLNKVTVNELQCANDVKGGFTTLLTMSRYLTGLLSLLECPRDGGEA